MSIPKNIFVWRASSSSNNCCSAIFLKTPLLPHLLPLDELSNINLNTLPSYPWIKHVARATLAAICCYPDNRLSLRGQNGSNRLSHVPYTKSDCRVHFTKSRRLFALSAGMDTAISPNRVLHNLSKAPAAAVVTAGSLFLGFRHTATLTI